MAIHLSNVKSSQSPKSPKATKQAAPAERWVVKIVQADDGRTAAWLGVLRNPEASRLTGQEVDAVKAAFRPDSKTFRFHIFWGNHALEVAAPGRAWYWLADVDGGDDLPEAEKMVAAALAGSKGRKAPKVVAEAPAKAKAAKAKAKADTKAQARQTERDQAKAKARKEAKPARKPAIILA